MRTRFLVAVLAAACLAACGDGYTAPTNNTPNTPEEPDGPGDTPAPRVDDQILVQDNSYSPSAASVPVGTTVTWTWTGGYTAHSVTFNDGVGSASAQYSGTHARTFTEPGSYAYHCSVHGSAMSGTVTVRPPE